MKPDQSRGPPASALSVTWVVAPFDRVTLAIEVVDDGDDRGARQPGDPSQLCAAESAVVAKRLDQRCDVARAQILWRAHPAPRRAIAEPASAGTVEGSGRSPPFRATRPDRRSQSG